LIQAHRRTINRSSRYEGVKFIRGLRTASVLQALIVATKLTAFGRVDSPKANARPMNFERVAVDDADLPTQIVRGRWQRTNAYRREDQLGKREALERQFERPNPFSANVLILCKRICSA
jgi:hypothetical protein